MSIERIELPASCPPLNTYYVYLTEGCNLACRHCWLSPKFQQDGGTGGHLDYDLFALAIEEGLPLGLRSVKLTGGEPLLHPDFIRMVDLLKEKEVGLTVETNGTLLTESLARYLKEKSTLGHISVSIDGAEAETHDDFRGVEGSFEQACQGVRYLAEAGYRPQVIMSLHQGNVDQIEALVRLAEEMGAGSVKFNLIQPTGRGELMAERSQTLDLYRLLDVGERIENELQKQVPFQLIYSWPIAFFSLRRLLNGKSGTCNLLNILGVLPTGYLAMCGIGVHIPELCYGRLGDDRVADVWVSNPTLITLRSNLPRGLQGCCADCIFRDRCLGHCVAENYFVSKQLTAPYWLCQMAMEAGVFPVSRLGKN